MAIINTKSKKNKSSRTDKVTSSIPELGLNLGAIVLSFTSAAFASYFIFWSPAVNNRISQAAVSQYLASTRESGGDPIITGSTTTPKNQPLDHYRIRGVDKTRAFLDVTRGVETDQIAIMVGDTVPGIGKILAIHSFNGNWYLQTDHGELASAGTLPDTN